jgi:hypothetical protein
MPDFLIQEALPVEHKLIASRDTSLTMFLVQKRIKLIHKMERFFIRKCHVTGTVKIVSI